MRDHASMRRAAAIAGVHPDTVARWVKAQRLKARPKRVGHMVFKMVRVDHVLKLAAAIRRGRPPKNPRV